MAMHLAEGGATKQFFVDMFTRDISLEDCILDLIDNSIDSLIRTERIDVSERLMVARAKRKTGIKIEELPLIDVRISIDKFEITDSCGGISNEDAVNEVFRFGHEKPIKGSQLGVYGIGLKRAIFKIGNNIEIASKSLKEGFKADIDVGAWVKDKNNWKIPLTFTSGAAAPEKAGTKIVITYIRPEIKLRIRSGTVEKTLSRTISKTYALFLDEFVRVKLNGDPIHPDQIPIGSSSEVTPGKETFEEKGVTATVITGIASKLPGGGWSAVSAGWYVVCNARVVVTADKSDLTGWGVGGPAFHSKYSGFVGVVFFYARDPHLLPWTTTKRDLNRESIVFQKARNVMIQTARPVITFLNEMYPSDMLEEPVERKIADQVRQADIRTIALKATDSNFTIKETRARATKTSVNVNISVEKVDVERVKRHLKKPSWSAKRAVEYAFEQYVKMECPE